MNLMNSWGPRTIMPTPLTNYSVEMDQTGLSGWIHYREPMLSMRFAFERLLRSVYIFVPGDEQWAAYCRSAGALHAATRRDEILQRIALEVRNQQVPSATVQISDFGIELLY